MAAKSSPASRYRGQSSANPLPGLRQVRLLVKIVHRKQSCRTFACCWSENWRVGERETTLVEEVARGFNDFRPHPQNRCLAWSAYPQVSMVHQKINAVFFERYWERIILRHSLQHLHARDVEFKSARSPLVRTHLAFYNHARFLRQSLYRIEDFRRNGILGDHPLNNSTPVTKNRK